jgi:hypothetical protein
MPNPYSILGDKLFCKYIPELPVYAGLGVFNGS